MRNPRGFTLIELLVVIAIIALLIGILLPALGSARRAGRVAVCSSNMKQLGVAAAGYTGDFKGFNYGFSWRAGYAGSKYSDLNGWGSDMEAARAQMVGILREKLQRKNFPMITSDRWVPQVYYAHLAMVEYGSGTGLDDALACPEDRVRQAVRRDFEGFLRDEIPGQPAPDGRNKAWAFSSSYEPSPASYDLTQSKKLTFTTWGARLSQGAAHNEYSRSGSGGQYGVTKQDRVVFPSGKVHVFDGLARHQSKESVYADPATSQPLLMFDGSVQNRGAGEANPGWNPRRPDTDQPEIINAPEYGFPQGGDNPLSGRYRWTRGGLRGLDFGGDEIDTSGW